VTNERIEAEIATEVKRIVTYIETVPWPATPSLYGEHWIGTVAWAEGLANHLVRNRMQVGIVRDAQHRRLMEAAKAALKELCHYVCCAHLSLSAPPCNCSLLLLKAEAKEEA